MITGHTRGLGKELYSRFGGVGLSKSTGFDISKDDIVPHLKDRDIDVFINNAYDHSNPWAQIKILYDAIPHVRKIICIGSNTTDQSKNWPHPYQSAKLALHNSCNQLYYQQHNISLVRPGLIDVEWTKTYDKPKIKPSEVVDAIEWLLKQSYIVKEILLMPSNWKS